MKKIAVIGISAKSASDEIRLLASSVDAIVNSWIAAKGKILVSADGAKTIHLGDKGEGALLEESRISEIGKTRKIQISEPIPHADGTFRTTLHLAVAENQVDVVCMLEFESPRYALTPAKPIANLPAVLRDIIRSSPLWRVGADRISADPIVYSGEDGLALSARIIDKNRSLPLVVVSRYRGREATERLSESLARDLAGLATVASIDSDASWQLTQELGRESSCYGGAIRLFWARPIGLEALRDPVWTRSEILALHKNRHGGGIREKLRNLLFDISSYRPRFSPLIKQIDDSSRAIEMKKRVEDARASGAELANAFAKDYERLEEENRRLKTDLDNSEAQLLAEREINAGLTQKIKLIDTLVPEPKEDRIENVADAVAAAKKKFAKELVFGADVASGVQTLNPKAGPPQKVFHWLSKLAELASQRKAGSLGKSLLKWLNDENIECSGESEQVRNSRKSQRKRTWDAGGTSRPFDLHLKVNERTDPGMCVRIYFDWDADAQAVVVGWVGQHPE